MQTRVAHVYCLNGEKCKLHYRLSTPKRPCKHKIFSGYDGGNYTHDVEVASTTKSVTIARVLAKGCEPSPWFELLEDTFEHVKQLIQWWTSGNALSYIMLRDNGED